MKKIAICIPTFKRPEMLNELVLSILNCNLNNTLIQEATIIIIDNDASKTAESTIKQLNKIQTTSLVINYYCFQKRGLSNIRNELFIKALEYYPDYILGIDDDEFVSPDWINQLLITIISNNGDIALGPVIPILERNVSTFISYWFQYRKIPNFKQIRFFCTSNYVISVKFLLMYRLEFDMRFNTSGGEDSYFGVLALKYGAKIYWAKDAIAYEKVTCRRATLKWLAKRRFIGAANFTFTLKIEKKYYLSVRKVFINLLYLIIGFASLVLLPFPLKFKYWGILRISECIGGFAGLFSIRLHEYGTNII